VRFFFAVALGAALLGVRPVAAQKVDSIVVLNDDVFDAAEESDPNAGFQCPAHPHARGHHPPHAAAQSG
jgi:hypothetical protein